jgi:hypothetical protein
MANKFVNVGQVGNISLTNVYTCPSSNTNGSVSASVVFTIQVANVTNRADVITILWTSASNSNAVTRLAFQVPVPANQSIGVLTGKLPLMPGDTIKAQCGIFQALEITLGTLETS